MCVCVCVCVCVVFISSDTLNTMLGGNVITLFFTFNFTKKLKLKLDVREISDGLYCKCRRQWKGAHTFVSQADAVDFGFLQREERGRLFS